MEISICQGHPVAPLLMMVDLPAALGFAQPSRNIWDRGLRGIHGPFKICASMICLNLKGDGFQCTVAQIAEGYSEYLTESSYYFYTFCLLSKILHSYSTKPNKKHLYWRWFILSTLLDMACLHSTYFQMIWNQL